MHTKITNNGYIIGVADAQTGEEITQEEYNMLTDVFHHAPKKEGYIYLLKTDLTWEEHKKEIEPHDSIDDSEALGILLGGTP